MEIIIYLFAFIGYMFKFFFFAVGVIFTGLVINQLLKERATRKGTIKAEQEIYNNRL